MASLKQNKSGNWRLRYYQNRELQEVRFVASRLNAEKMKQIVEHRLVQIQTGEADAQLAKWLKDIPQPLREVLEKRGLFESTRRRVTVRELVDEFMRFSGDVKPNTVSNRRSAAKNLLDHFGGDCVLDSISAREADHFYHWMKHESKTCGKGTALKPGTYLRRIKTIKMIFALAVRYKWLEENPFAHLKGGNATDESRLVFVTSADAIKVYDACPNAFWRLVWAFTRWGGLRIRSEFPHLRWDGILWQQNKITVYEPKKTRHGESLKTRFIPIFPELRDVLNEVWDLSEEGDVYLADFYGRLPGGAKVRRDGSWNPSTTLRRIVLKAGVTPWPKLLQNCRSTRETELAAIFPIHDVTKWIGNTPRVAITHYLQSTDDNFQRAVNGVSILSEPPTETPSPTPARAVSSTNSQPVP